jgi:hypothetical protein
MIIWVGALLREKLKNGGAAPGGVAVVFELTELDVLEEVAAVLEEVVVLEDGVALEEDVAVLDGEVVLDEEAFCPDLG